MAESLYRQFVEVMTSRSSSYMSTNAGVQASQPPRKAGRLSSVNEVRAMFDTGIGGTNLRTARTIAPVVLLGHNNVPSQASFNPHNVAAFHN